MNIHPLMQNICNAHINSAIDAHKAQVQAYVELLKRHDWQHAYSDDQRVWRKGTEERNELNMVQRLIDKDCAIWNEFCPAEFQKS